MIKQTFQIQIYYYHEKALTLANAPAAFHKEESTIILIKINVGK